MQDTCVTKSSKIWNGAQFTYRGGRLSLCWRTVVKRQKMSSFWKLVSISSLFCTSWSFSTFPTKKTSKIYLSLCTWRTRMSSRCTVYSTFHFAWRSVCISTFQFRFYTCLLWVFRCIRRTTVKKLDMKSDSGMFWRIIFGPWLCKPSI